MSRSKRNYDHLVDFQGNYKGLGGGGGGSALNFVGSVPNAGSLPNPYPGEPGDAYYIDDGSDQYYAWDGATWNNVGTALKGQKGAVGDKGSIGLKGASGGGGGTGSKGTKGALGPKGEIGEKGEIGIGQKGASGGAAAKGDVGPKGDEGPKGEVGPKGEIGVGQKGDLGAKGESGSKGVEGDKGEIGQKGATGIQGIQGDKGLKGELNDKGAKGDDGTAAALLAYQGNVPDVPSLPVGAAAGDTYYVDDGSSLYYSWDGSAWVSSGQAVKGDIGVQGQKGVTGATGTDGNDGATGAKGEPGNKGQLGAIGPKGEQNAKGAVGATGAKGAKADKGDNGQKGEDGTAAALLAYQGNVADVASLPAGATSGDTYFVEDGSSLYYSWDGTAWVSAGQAVKGDEGPLGPKGAKGELGAKGEKGEEAEKGEKGKEGKGEKGEVGVQGNVGPKGEKGEKADKGEKGEDADKGEKGEAADKGQKGEEADKGDKGVKGIDADKGRQGFRGVKGQMVAAGVTAHVTFNGETTTTAGGTLGPSDVYAQYGIDKIERFAEGMFDIYFSQPFKLAYTQPELDAGVDSDGNTIPAPPAGTTLDLNNPIYYRDKDNSYSAVGTCGGDEVSSSRALNVLSLGSSVCRVACERSGGSNENTPFVTVAFYGTGSGGVLVQKGEPGDGKGTQGSKGEEGEKGETGQKGLIPAGAASAHTSFDGSAGNAFDWTTDTRAYYNVSNITRQNVGVYTIFWDTAFTSDAYTVVGSAGTGDMGGYALSVSIDDQQAGYVIIRVERGDDGNEEDPGSVSLVAYGNGDTGIYSTIKGDKGIQGPATIAVGTTTTVQHPASATVTNSGTTTDNILDFEIPAGEKGERQLISAGAVTCHATFVATAGLANGVLAAGDIKSSFGVDSIEKIRDGEFTVTFTNPFTGADNYSAVGTAHGDYGDFVGGSTRVIVFNTFTANSVLCEIEESNGDRGSADTVSVVFYGDGTMGDLLEIKGEPGEKGPTGGEKGEPSTVPGPSPTITIGNVASVPSNQADVTNSGVLGAAVFNFELPKGEKGQNGAAVDKGDEGPKGEIGEKGDEGVIANVKFSYVAFDASAGAAFSWSTAEIASKNVTNIQRISAGRYEIFWGSNYSGSAYSVQAYAFESNDSWNGYVNVLSRSSASMIIEVGGANGVLDDACDYINIMAMAPS